MHTRAVDLKFKKSIFSNKMAADHSVIIIIIIIIIMTLI